MLAEVEAPSHLSPVDSAPLAHPTARQALLLTVLLGAANLLSMIDAQAFPLLVTPIKAAFKLSDFQVGSLGLAMSVSWGLCALPVGYLVDKKNRVRLLATGVLFWSLFTALGGLCSNYLELFFCRLAIGMAESVVYPAAFSLIADLYDAQSRAKAISIYYCASSIISGLAATFCGLMISGVMAFSARFGSQIPMPPVWRTTLFLIAVPGLILAALFLNSKEPARRQEIDDRDGGSSIFRFLLKQPFLSAALILAPPLSWVGSNAFVFWLPTILTRQFGLHLDVAGETFGLAIAFGTAIGTLISAAITWKMRERSELKALFRPFQIGIFCAAIVTPVFLLAKNPQSLLLVYLLLQTVDYVAVPAVANMIVRVTPGNLRGRFFGVGLFTGVCINSILPPAVGALSDKVFFGPSAPLLGCLAISIPTAIVAAFFLVGFTARFVRAAGRNQMDNSAAELATGAL